MPKRSFEELRRQVSAREYALDSGAIASEMLSKFALISRVRALLTGEEENTAAASALRARIRRGARPPAPETERPGTNAASKEPPG